jgi:hypothetical protein
MDECCPHCGATLGNVRDAFCSECRQPLDEPAPAPRAAQEQTTSRVGAARLIPCSACGRQISTEAEACPQCGHPNRLATSTLTGPKCYACSSLATTRCQSCGAMSCAQHLQSIFVWHGRGGAYELRCESCYSSAQTWKVVGWVIGGIVLVIILIIWSQMGRH